MKNSNYDVREFSHVLYMQHALEKNLSGSPKLLIYISKSIHVHILLHVHVRMYIYSIYLWLTCFFLLSTSIPASYSIKCAIHSIVHAHVRTC